MQRAPVTIEEQLILKAIKEECPWENLPKRLQATLNSKEDWHRRVIEHCIKKRLQWNTCFARKVCKEGEYYEDMMRYLRKNLALFPYHLAEYVCRVMRLSPFRYYCDMIFEVMRNEQPYDSIPNFSAADALRLTGIGRNEFIDIMNKCRSKKIMWKLNKSIAKELLPTQPVDFTIEPWWGVLLAQNHSASLFFPLILMLITILSRLLYAVFVVSSENATVAELASTLQADLSQLQAAASFACRLGWAEKLIDPGSILQETSIPGTPNITLGDEEDAFQASIRSANMFNDSDSSQHGDLMVTEHSGPRSNHTQVAFIVDANITSYLMMGSVSPGLKSHAVTLYEAGKLGHASIADLCKDLSTLEGAKFEGELQEFANHAFSLRCVLECLLSGGVAADVKVEEGSNKIGTASSSIDEASSLIGDVALTENSENIGADEVKIYNDDSVNSSMPEAGSALANLVSGSPDDPVILSEDINPPSEVSKSDQDVQNDDKLIPFGGSDAGEGTLKRRRDYRVDILRCESLAALAPSTLNSLFLRDYDIVVSIVPLPHSAVLPGPKGPIHFGPPSHSSLTPWMKLVLYSTVGSGPLSVVLMKGQSLRLLPAPLAGCEKALIWSWDGSTIGGLGGKFEGNLVKGSILLHCLNSLLKYSAVLVQPLSKYDLDESGKVVTVDVPLPLNNSDGSIVCVGNELGLFEEESLKLNTLLTNLTHMMELPTIGYIRLLKLFSERESEHFAPGDKKYEWVPLSVEFGIPLFSPKLSNNICKRVVASELLQSDTLTEHYEAMQGIRKRLRDVCAEYQATGPTAKLLYQKEQSKESPRQLMNYASGRWNPLVDPSSPISGALSEHQRLKLANRQRCRTEVLSFDGSILRSYALTPVYEAATRSIEETSMVNSTKADPDEADSREVVLPGVNLIFDGSELHPFDIGACLQARQPVSLIAEAASASATTSIK
ncbi:protein FAM91A [Salix suchowensis]|nr:protein FAM91A [Salix suchowensis]